MEHEKILNLLNKAYDFKFVTRKWSIANDQSSKNYYVRNDTEIYNTEILKSHLGDYNDAYILVRGEITILVYPVTQVAFKNCAPFTKYITKIDGTTIGDAEDLDLVMSMCSLIEHSSNYSDITGSLQFYSKDEASNFDVDIAINGNFKSLKYKAKLLRDTVADGADGILRDTTIGVRLTYLSSFWQSLEIPLIKIQNKIKT